MVILSEDYTYPSQLTKRILFKNNVIEQLHKDYYANSGGFTIVGGGAGTADLVIRNNLVLHDGPGNNFMNLGDTQYTADALWFENNIVTHADYGLHGSGKGVGKAALDYYARSYSFKKNLIIFRAGDREYGSPALRAAYPQDNLFVDNLAEAAFADYSKSNYRLLPGSPGKSAGTDGKDLGPDFEALERAMAAPDGSTPAPPKNLRVLR